MSLPSCTDEIYASIISFTLAITGIITNGAAVLVIVHKKHLHNAFGYSCMSHAIGGLGVLLIFATWVPLKLLLTPELMPKFLKSDRLDYTIGQITIIFYYGSIYTHLLISLNRFIAISLPFSYGKYFNDRKTIKWIAFIWTVAFIQSCVYQFDGCHYYFSRSSILFIYTDALCGRIISIYFEFYVNLVFVIFEVSLDVLTFLKLNKILKGMVGQRGNERGVRELKSQEIRFFFQSVCSETALVLLFVCFWGVAVRVSNPFIVFLLNVGAWETLHTVDGIIMVAFNHRICSCKKKQSVISVVTGSIPEGDQHTPSRRVDARIRYLNYQGKINKVKPFAKQYTKPSDFKGNSIT